MTQVRKLIMAHLERMFLVIIDRIYQSIIVLKVEHHVDLLACKCTIRQSVEQTGLQQSFVISDFFCSYMLDCYMC